MTMTLLALNPDIHAALEVHLGNHEAFLDLCNTMIEENMLAKIGEQEGELLDVPFEVRRLEKDYDFKAFAFKKLSGVFSV